MSTPTLMFQEAMRALSPLVGSGSRYPDRITDDEQGVLLAMTASLRADCTRRKVGAIVADAHGRIVGTGRNGAPPGMPGCLTAGACPRGRLSTSQVAPLSSYSGQGWCIANHGERNAIMFTSPLARRGGTLYISCGPCKDCVLMIAGSGLARVVWPVEVSQGNWRVGSRLIEPSMVIDLSSTTSALEPDLDHSDHSDHGDHGDLAMAMGSTTPQDPQAECDPLSYPGLRED